MRNPAANNNIIDIINSFDDLFTKYAIIIIETRQPTMKSMWRVYCNCPRIIYTENSDINIKNGSKNRNILFF